MNISITFAQSMRTQLPSGRGTQVPVLCNPLPAGVLWLHMDIIQSLAGMCKKVRVL
jgi:hypothetical protein